MDIKNFDFIDLEAFHEQININLFNDVIGFIIATTDKEAQPLFRKLQDEHLWFSRSETTNTQEKYGFRYFGELLERFEERFGNDRKDLRGIALAMACARELLTDDMFVGNQRVNFIRKIERLSANDIYLKGALYLLYLREGRADSLHQEFICATYSRTEELVFALSLFEEFEDGFTIFKPQLLDLLGKAKSIPVVHNMRIFVWLARNLFPLTKKIKTKDMALFRALATLPTMFAKEGSKPRETLLKNGYSLEEIVYANSALLFYRPVWETVNTSSIVAEKIAIEFCKVYINSENTHSENTYDYLRWLFRRYEIFEIKCYGYKKILEALAGEVKLANPQTFLWLLKAIGIRPVFRFNVFENKWDVLSNSLKAKDYLELFDMQMENDKAISTVRIQEYIRKYDSLAEFPYLRTFETHNYSRDRVFALLVQYGLINLQTAFVEHVQHSVERDRDGDPVGMALFIRRYIEDLSSREAFVFYQFLFEHHYIAEIKSLFGRGFRFSEPLYHGPSRYYGDHNREISLERPFLSNEEHRQLYGWLDEFMFTHEPDKYMEFIVCVLKDDFVEKIIPKAELRQLYDMVCQTDSSLLNGSSNQLKRKYLTEEELRADQEAEEARKREAARKEKLRERESMCSEFRKEYNDGTFKSLLEFQDRHVYWDEKRVMALRIIQELIDGMLENRVFRLNSHELGHFIQLGGVMIDKGVMTYEELKSYITKIKEDVLDGGNNKQGKADSTA